MRTTLDLDSDVLDVVKQVASATGTSAGAAACALIRRALSEVRVMQEHEGILLFPAPPPGVTVTAALVDRLSDELP